MPRTSSSVSVSLTFSMMMRPMLERVAMQGSSRSASSASTILIGPDAASTGETAALREPRTRAPAINDFFIPFSSQIRNSATWRRTARGILKSPVSCIEEHGVRMTVSSTREQSIGVIAFFVNLFFRSIFYSRKISYFYHLKTDI
ncbi:conserved hypothetical protein [Agrobacterium sp. NCPPB 925]|nr:conserved hypothetical protein [Agrobacterium sp. NCPPB 925]